MFSVFKTVIIEKLSTNVSLFDPDQTLEARLIFSIFKSEQINEISSTQNIALRWTHSLTHYD